MCSVCEFHLKLTGTTSKSPFARPLFLSYLWQILWAHSVCKMYFSPRKAKGTWRTQVEGNNALKNHRLLTGGASGAAIGKRSKCARKRHRHYFGLFITQKVSVYALKYVCLCGHGLSADDNVFFFVRKIVDWKQWTRRIIRRILRTTHTPARGFKLHFSENNNLFVDIIVHLARERADWHNTLLNLCHE